MVKINKVLLITLILIFGMINVSFAETNTSNIENSIGITVSTNTYNNSDEIHYGTPDNYNASEDNEEDYYNNSDEILYGTSDSYNALEDNEEDYYNNSELDYNKYGYDNYNKYKYKLDDLNCENIPELKGELNSLNNLIKNQNLNISPDKVRIYRTNKDNIIKNLNRLEGVCNNRNNIENVVNNNLDCENSPRLREELKKIDNLIKNTNNGAISEQIKNYQKTKTKIKNDLNKIENICNNNRPNENKVRNSIQNKIDQHKVFRNERKIVIDNYKDDKNSFNDKKSELIEKHKNGNLTIDEVKEFMKNGLNHELDRIDIYLEKLDESNFPNKQNIEEHLNNVADELNEYINEIINTQSKKELFVIGKRIKKVHDIELKRFAYFNAVIMSGNYDQIIEKVETLIDKIETNFEGEYSEQINNIEEELDKVKTKIDELNSITESYDADNLGKGISDFRTRNNKIREDIKNIFNNIKKLGDDVKKDHFNNKNRGEEE